MEKSREQFEEFYESRFKHLPNNSYKGVFWSFWKASRENLEVELPRKHDEDDEYDYYAIGYNSAIDKIKSIFVENGVKVK